MGKRRALHRWGGAARFLAAPEHTSHKTLDGTMTEVAFQASRDQRDWIARKQAMWDRSEKLPSQQPPSLMRCPCGATFDSHRPRKPDSHPPHLRRAKARWNSTMKMKEEAVGRTRRKPRAGSWSTPAPLESIQDGRIYIEKINYPMIDHDKATPAEYWGGLQFAKDQGWLDTTKAGPS